MDLLIKVILILLISITHLMVHASVPVPYSGKISIDGVNFGGQLKFKFGIYNSTENLMWHSGKDSISVPVINGRYMVLLGGQGMQPLPTSLFHEHDELYLGVYTDLPSQDVTQEEEDCCKGKTIVMDGANSKGVSLSNELTLGKGGKLCFTSLDTTPGPTKTFHCVLGDDVNNTYIGAVALSLEKGLDAIENQEFIYIANNGDKFSASFAGYKDQQYPGPRFYPYSCDKQFSGFDRLGNLQRITANPYALVAEIAKSADFANRADTAKYAEFVKDSSITKSMLGQDVLTDLGRTITYSDLSLKVKADLNRTITKSMLGQDVLADLNRTIEASDIAQNAITVAQLNEQILKYLKPEIVVPLKAPGLVFEGQSFTLSSKVEGKYLNYQWQKDGEPIFGANGDSFLIEQVSKTSHDGTYTLEVSNDFGKVTTSPITIDVNATPTNYLVPSIELDMIWCPFGIFKMGSPGNELSRKADETEHNVSITKGFYLGKYELTQSQYKAVIGSNPSEFNATGNEDLPVESVSWAQAVEFCNQLTTLERNAGRIPLDWEYKLPTEAQWEYACRAGTSTAYSWGNEISSSEANWNHANDSNQTKAIGNYEANTWGFFDMHGNVAEWIEDGYNPYSTENLVIDPSNPDPSIFFGITRGGAWATTGVHLRSASRRQMPRSAFSTDVGFRVSLQKNSY